MDHGEVGGAACAGCHCANATGTTLGPDLTSTDWLWGDGGHDAITRTIAKGVLKPRKFRSHMPPMGVAQLSSDQVSAVASCIWALSDRTAATSTIHRREPP